MEEKISMIADGKPYSAEFEYDADYILYTIYQHGKLLFTIGLNEEGKWESTTDADQQLVQKIGQVIDKTSL